MSLTRSPAVFKAGSRKAVPRGRLPGDSSARAKPSPGPAGNPWTPSFSADFQPDGTSQAVFHPSSRRKMPPREPRTPLPAGKCPCDTFPHPRRLEVAPHGPVFRSAARFPRHFVPKRAKNPPFLPPLRALRGSLPIKVEPANEAAPRLKNPRRPAPRRPKNPPSTRSRPCLP